MANNKPKFLSKIVRYIVQNKMVKTKLKRELGLFDVFCVSSGAMISSGLFVLIALAFSKTGPSVILSYLIASLLVLPTVLAKAEMVTALPKTGGIFVFIDRSMGPLVGMLAGLAAWFSLAFKTAFALLGMGLFISLINPGFTLWQEKLFAVGFCIFFTIINIIGVKVTGRFQSILVLILIVILLGYVGVGIFSVEISRFTPFMSGNLATVFATAGLVFVSFSGTTKIAAIAGEIKNPDRNVPLGILLSWGLVSLLYLVVIYVTVGVVEPNALQNSVAPISLGGEKIMGGFGLMLMSLAGLLAFITTGNAGILATSRTPMAMGKTGLLPSIFEKVSKRGTPWVSILFTSIFMAAVILFLDLENFVKVASTLKLILFSLANLALIFFRYKKKKHYNPAFKAPLFPWLQIIGIAGYGLLILDMGRVPLTITGVFIVSSLIWYFLFVHFKVKRQFEIVQIIKKAAEVEPKDYLLDEELREILIEKDELIEKRLEQNIKDCVLLDLKQKILPKELYRKGAEILAKKLNISANVIYNEFLKKGEEANVIARSGFAIVFAHVKGKGKFKVALIRTKYDVKLAEKLPETKAFFFVVASPDIRHFYLKALMCMVQIAEEKDFVEMWQAAKTDEELKKVIFSLWKKHCHLK